MVEEVQSAIDPFWCPSNDEKCQSGLPPLKQVKLALQTVRDTKGVGQVDYLVWTVQGSKDYSETHEIDVTLTPHPISSDPLAETYDELADIRRALMNALSSAQQSIKEKYGEGSKQLDTDEVTAQISFAVTWDGKVGGAKVPVRRILASPSLERSLKTTNTITVTFAKIHKRDKGPSNTAP
jgi:hypothetical protein